MPRNSKSQTVASAANPARTIRILLGALVALNLVAAWLVLSPPGGSAESLDAELTSLQAQVAKGRANVRATRDHSDAVEKGRGAGDQFQAQYFLARRTAFSVLVSELSESAQRAGIQEKGNSYAPELIDGSDILGMLTITANYEGSYRNLLAFVRELDRSKNLLIIESLNATPQPTGNILSVSMKINAFFRDEPEAVAEAAANGQELTR